MKLNFMYLMQAEAHAGGGAGVGSSARAVDALDVRAATTQVNHAQAVSIYNEFVDHANKQAVEKGLPEVYKKFHELTVEDVIGDELQPGVPADPNSPAAHTSRSRFESWVDPFGVYAIIFYAVLSYTPPHRRTYNPRSGRRVSDASCDNGFGNVR
mmetsp:Transcript_34579/g.77638  ORF Transcript_34579/g.77638 Transcript_34579/m.77638 type:complete len:155 (-) Transcript_34579:76-540(-)